MIGVRVNGGIILSLLMKIGLFLDDICIQSATVLGNHFGEV